MNSYIANIKSANILILQLIVNSCQTKLPPIFLAENSVILFAISLGNRIKFVTENRCYTITRSKFILGVHIMNSNWSRCAHIKFIPILPPLWIIIGDLIAHVTPVLGLLTSCSNSLTSYKFNFCIAFCSDLPRILEVSTVPDYYSHMYQMCPCKIAAM